MLTFGLNGFKREAHSFMGDELRFTVLPSPLTQSSVDLIPPAVLLSTTTVQLNARESEGVMSLIIIGS